MQQRNDKQLIFVVNNTFLSSALNHNILKKYVLLVKWLNLEEDGLTVTCVARIFASIQQMLQLTGQISIGMTKSWTGIIWSNHFESRSTSMRLVFIHVFPYQAIERDRQWIMAVYFYLHNYFDCTIYVYIVYFENAKRSDAIFFFFFHETNRKLIRVHIC